jgi:predicted ATPase
MLCSTAVAKEPFIRNLTLKGFRSIAADQIELDNPTFLVGENGSGKSNLADAFAFLADALVGQLQSAFEKRGGVSSVLYRGARSNTLGLAVTFNGPDESEVQAGRYAFAIKILPEGAFEVTREHCLLTDRRGKGYSFDRMGDHLTSDVEGLRPLLDPASLCLPLIGGHALFAPVVRALGAMRVYDLEPARLREAKEFDGSMLHSDGRNAASILERIGREHPEELERIGGLLGVVVPHGMQVRAARQGSKLHLEFTEAWDDHRHETFGAMNASKGALRTVGLLTAVLQDPIPPLLVLEEPDKDLHPNSFGVLLDILRIAMRRTQILVTSHSPELLDTKWITEQFLRVALWESGETRIARLSEGSKRVLQEHLAGAGELLRTNSLDTAPLPQLEAEASDLFSRVG